MLEQLGLIGTIRDEEESPEEPDTESDQEVSLSGRHDTSRRLEVSQNSTGKQQINRWSTQKDLNWKKQVQAGFLLQY